MMRTVISFFFLFLFIACNKENIPKSEIPSGEDAVNRTLLIYLARDNNLATYQEEKINYILEGWNGEGGNIVIYQDKKDEHPTLYKIIRENNKNELLVIEKYEEENSASSDVLGRVIKDIKNAYPANSYGLIFFSHASGWIPERIYDTTRSIGQDGDEVMEISDFASAIPDKMFDFIIFEACHMAGIEIAYELKDKTNYILASAAEIVSPGFRNIYPEAIEYLFYKEPALENFAKKAFNWLNKNYSSATISIIKTEGIPLLAQWLKENMTGEFTGKYNSLQYFDRKYNHLFYDFQDYFSYTIPTDKKGELKTLISACVPYEQTTSSFLVGYGIGSFDIEKHSGLTTYVMKDELDDLNEKYKLLKWYQAVYE